MSCAALQRRFAGALLAVGSRRASTGRRDFFQRINEQHLARDLEGLTVGAHGAQAPNPGLFDPKIRVGKPRRLVPAASEAGLAAPAGQPELDPAAGGFGPPRRRTKPWLHYESLRGTTYPGKRPEYQDLTHSEAQRLQEMYMRKRMLDRKIMWLKEQHLPNPQKEAKMTLRREKKAEQEEKAAESSGMPMYPPPFMDVRPESGRLQRMEDAARQEELESRFRARIRQEKLENARIVKAATPTVGGLITDPIKRHVHRRLVRQRTKIHAGLEELLTRNSAQILYEFLRGVSISIVRVSAKRPRQTQEIYYNLTSDHDPVWVQRQLDILAPKLRSQFALKVNMGQTPNIRFMPHVAASEVRRAYLWRHAREIKEQIPAGGGFGADVGVG